MKGRKRHLLVATQGLVLRAKVHTASVFDRDGIKPLIELVEGRFPSLSHLWLDAGYNGKGKGKDWAEKVLGLTVEVVRPPRRRSGDRRTALIGAKLPTPSRPWCNSFLHSHVGIRTSTADPFVGFGG